MRNLVIISALLLGLFACKQQSNRVNTLQGQKQIQEDLVNVNKYLVKKDAEAIKAFAERREWEMQESKTGLYYQIYEQGEGRKAEKDKIVTLNYSVKLLDGTLCYSSDSLGAKVFKIGMGGVEAGLEEGILLLREGDKARFIMPPYMAHGLVGDDNKIPARSIIIYNVELLKIED